MSLGILVLVGVALLDGLDQLGQLGLVLRAHLGQGEDGSGLLVNNRAETSLALDDGIRYAHLSAQSGEEDDQLDGIDIVGDEDQRSLLIFDQANDMVQTVLGNVWLLAHILLLLTLLDGRGLFQQSLLLLGLALGPVLVEELKGLGGGVAIEDVLELGDRRWDLEAHVQDLLLALEADILGPFHHAREVAAGLDILANAKVAAAFLNERVLGSISFGHRKIVILAKHTFGAFLEPAPARDAGNGAGAAFFPALGGYH